ncbi:hypothetical protein D9757_006194 [Collybiopsis confluens]|uniref:peptidyl-tRNA hydrolase n=1 Tax=Collybiopsis confluens TaxID=2823264 RepID=A0A8H5HK73_9AGAR|nr:hypothetical protein D9757_006194 [Collybiopsis confluens]
MRPRNISLLQGAHAEKSNGEYAYTHSLRRSLCLHIQQLVRHWERTGQAKIALKGDSEETLLELEAIAKSLNFGRTQIEAGTRTVLAIGPAPVALINQVTGSLRLL